MRGKVNTEKLTRKNSLQTAVFSDMISAMEAQNQESPQAVEPNFLSQALTDGARLRVGQMNKTEHNGVIRDVGRYEINLDENGKLVTILKQEIAFLSSSQPVLQVPALPPLPEPELRSTSDEPARKPNIQQEFLDKAIRENQLLTLFLINGQRIKANIEAYDNFTILLREGGRQHLYYKHAVTTINR